MTKVLLCGCAHGYQDRRYGPGMRVHNVTKKKTWRCTVCEREK